MTQNTSSVDAGEIIFVQHHIPPLQAGEYLITVEQDIVNTNPTGTGDTIDEGYIHTRHIAVRGERFTLDPSEFNTIFPPADNQGEYDNVLPHAVFTRRILPWERSPDETDTGRPWLALFVFHAADPPPVASAIQVGDLQRSPFFRAADATEPSASTLPATAVSYPDGFAALPPGESGAHARFELEYGENMYDHCRAIDIPVALFNVIAPSLEDLTWLAHARTVSPENKSGVPVAAGIDYSIVVANRLPEPDERCTVYLVSLEGMGAFLPADGTYAPATILLPDGTTPAESIRLVSLSNWSFTSADPAQTFEGYLENVLVGPLQLPPTPPSVTPPSVTPPSASSASAASDADDVVTNAFAMGYTAMNHRTRLGDSTVSWYRGPLMPFQAPDTIFIPIPDPSTTPVVEPITSSDQLLRYDPTTGMFDATYAAAWEMGRLLALQNKGFSVALYNWKRGNAQATALTAEREILEQQFGPVLGLTRSALHDGGSIAEATARFITTSLKEHLVAGSPQEDMP